MLAQADDEPIIIVDSEEAHERSLLLSDSQATLPVDEPLTRVTSATEFEEGGFAPTVMFRNHERLKPTRKSTGVFHSFPNTPNRSFANLAGEASCPTNLSATTSRSVSTIAVDEDEDEEDQSPVGLPHHRRNPTTPTSTRFQSLMRRSRRRAGRAWATFNEFMTVPLWAAILSLIVACVPQLQHTLEVHMQPVKGALASAGNCSIPVTLVVLGAYFYTPKEGSGKPSQSLLKGVRQIFSTRSRKSSVPLAPKPAVRPGETKTVVIAILSRMVIVPLLLMPLMALSTWYDWHAVFEE